MGPGEGQSLPGHRAHREPYAENPFAMSSSGVDPPASGLSIGRKRELGQDEQDQQDNVALAVIQRFSRKVASTLPCAVAAPPNTARSRRNARSCRMLPNYSGLCETATHSVVPLPSVAGGSEVSWDLMTSRPKACGSPVTVITRWSILHSSSRITTTVRFAHTRSVTAATHEFGHWQWRRIKLYRR